MKNWFIQNDKDNYIYIDDDSKKVYINTKHQKEKRDLEKILAYTPSDDLIIFKDKEHSELQAVNELSKDSMVVTDLLDENLSAMLSTLYDSVENKSDMLNMHVIQKEDATHTVTHRNEQPEFYDMEMHGYDEPFFTKIEEGHLFNPETNKFEKIKLKDMNIKQIHQSSDKKYIKAYGKYKGENRAVIISNKNDVSSLDLPSLVLDSKFQNYNIVKVNDIVNTHTNPGFTNPLLLSDKENMFIYDDKNGMQVLDDLSNFDKLENADIYLSDSIHIPFSDTDGKEYNYSKSEDGNTSLSKNDLRIAGTSKLIPHSHLPLPITRDKYINGTINNINLNKANTGC